MIPVGVVGPIASGKGTLCGYLEENFKARRITLSEIIAEEAVKRKIDPKIRENLQKLGDELRKEFGGAILAEKAIEKLSEENIDYEIIDGVRAVQEAQYIKSKSGYIIGLDAALEERFERHIYRPEKKDDILILEDFQKKDESDRFGDKTLQDKNYTRSVEKCLSLADFLIWNPRSFKQDHLYQMAQDFMELIQGKKRRPGWEEVFMYESYILSKRRTCLRRSVGAILTKNNRQIASGYNGQAAGTKHCKDLGCIREEMKIPSGERRELCRAVHAELNSIIQCAVHGPSSENSILYVTTSPCSICTNTLIQSKLKEVIYFNYYPDSFAEQIWRESPSTKFRRFQGVTPNWYAKVFE